MSGQKKVSFSSKVGLIMAAAGGAVGLGNIWKFPYVAGENGGGAFLIIYLLCVLFFGMPMVMTEFLIGKRSGKSPYGAFRELSGNNRWQWLGWLSMLTALLIMGFYFLVTGWCFSYLVEAVMNTFGDMSVKSLTEHFTAVTTNTPRMIVFSVLPILLTASVLIFDVNKGIERLSKILMPLLLVMMFLMVGRVLMLEGSHIGIQFFFQADFSKITPKVVIEAIGQCFFSLSVGMGALITYGSYMPKTQNVTMTSIQVITLDTLVAILAGVIIFPAVFAFGFDPAEGEELVFVVLPAIFEKMSFTWLSGVLFFSLLCIAAITSTISLMEVAVAFVCEASGGKLNRKLSVGIIAVLTVALTVGNVLFGPLFSYSDKITSCVMMPIGALGMALFVGWFLPRTGEKSILSADKGIKWRFKQVYLILLRFVVPVAIVIIFLNSLGLF